MNYSVNGAIALKSIVIIELILYILPSNISSSVAYGASFSAGEAFS